MTRVSSRARLVASLVACALASVLPLPATAAPCAGFKVVPSIGPSCVNPDGSLSVYSRSGMFLGITHGLDPSPGTAAAGTSPAAAAPAPVAPSCSSGAAGDYYFVAIYARASDDADGYAARAGDIRTMLGSVNGFLSEAASDTGDYANARFLCSAGTVVVKNEVLPTTRASSDFSSIVSDLRAKGYDDPHLKYAVFFDDTSVCSCGGQGMYIDDERLIRDNLNNGMASYPMFAVDYGYLNARTMLHEMAHTLGAVGNHAPHTTGGHHCYDGLDVMCYNDGAPKGGLYNGQTCSVEVFDCNKDDYFNSRPMSGSYLAANWNIASRMNRYLSFPRPMMQVLACPPKSGVGRTFYCSFYATDDSSGVSYSIQWGDGSTARHPVSGLLTPGTNQSTSHQYDRAGTFVVHVTATDNGSPAETSSELTAVVQAVADNVAPVMNLIDPAPGTIYNGCGTKQPTAGAGPPVFTQKGCATVTVSDADSGISRVSLFMGASHMGTLYKAPWVFSFGVGLPGANVPITVYAWDNAGNMTQQRVDVVIA